FAAAGDIRPRGALRLPRHVNRCAASWPGARRQLGGDQRDYWHARGRRHVTRPCIGAARILGLGRNRDVLAQLKALAPDRIEVLALGDAPIADWMRQHSDQLGVDVLIDCSARSAAAANTAEALAALKRGAIAVNIGALTEPLAIQPMRFMAARLQFCGSNWFTTGEGQSMAEMAQV